MLQRSEKRSATLLSQCEARGRTRSAPSERAGVCARFSVSVRGKDTVPSASIAVSWRILKYTRTSPCNLLIGLIYLQRLKNQTGRQLVLTSFNTQRLLLTASMLASKMYDDYLASNSQWALVGGLSLQELDQLELEMLFQLGFSLTVSREEFDHCYDQIVR